MSFLDKTYYRHEFCFSIVHFAEIKCKIMGLEESFVTKSEMTIGSNLEYL